MIEDVALVAMLVEDALLDAGFDALRDRDLALAREQRHLAHLAQVDADGIVGDASVLAARVGGARAGALRGAGNLRSHARPGHQVRVCPGETGN